MRLIIKNAKIVNITPASQANHLDVDIEGVETEDLLTRIDIITAIEYYGMTELLDTIREHYGIRPLLDTIGEVHLKSPL
ncbi:hypothetical protein G7074_00500 [Pedobacter sp. HDW13]|uniref:hypothetical protein n=1 Tax=Pedobacter sp. HDW13 TaxID=2714940 RepID=UPI001407E61F|nr:hypothetical protein [Pedobacter sp. HDW13]QIL37895.1 hypothetical protein G7074_00500 [Pedobacter sp. HDW13]